MNASLALAAIKLHKAVIARQLFIGQRDALQADTVNAIDHQLVSHLTTAHNDYLRAGGTLDGAKAIARQADLDASAQLDS